MLKTFIFIFIGLIGGIAFGFSLVFFGGSKEKNSLPQVLRAQTPSPRQVIGFLPYWLLDKAHLDYSQDITMLSYFALRIDTDGTILKLLTPTQEEPGYAALQSDKVQQFFSSAKSHNIPLSLVIDSGDVKAIDGFVSNPIVSGQNLVSGVNPLMQKFGFSDLNLDIEYTQTASQEAKQNFTQFVQEVRRDIPQTVTLTLEISSLDAVHDNLIDVKHITPFANNIVLMAYDYHAPNSMVSGPVAPLSGAGISSEYDVVSAVEKTLSQIPSSKVILGVPLYGYEWETLGSMPRSAVIPGSGVIASAKRVASFLATCATCSAQFDTSAQESYISYFNSDTNTNHIIFYPNDDSMKSKIDVAKKNTLGGLALWALGYENDTLLDVLPQYKN